MKLAGGKTVEVYRNRKCRVCKSKVFQTVCCRKEKANICRDVYIGKRQKSQKKTTTKKKKNKTAQGRILSGSAVAPNHYINYK